MSEIQEERDFLVTRIRDRDSSWVGLSSDAMTVWAIAGAGLPPPQRWPSDEGDLGRCEETLRRAPAHLKDRMEQSIARWSRHVAEGGLYCRGCDNSIGHTYTRRNLCPACFEDDA